MSEGPGLSLLSLRLCPVEQQLSQSAHISTDISSERWENVKTIYGYATTEGQTVTELYSSLSTYVNTTGARIIKLWSGAVLNKSHTFVITYVA